MIGASIEQTVAAFQLLQQGMISRGTFNAIVAQPSRRKGFGSFARRYGAIRKPPVLKLSKAAKQKARAQARNRKAHRKAVRG